MTKATQLKIEQNREDLTMAIAIVYGSMKPNFHNRMQIAEALIHKVDTFNQNLEDL